MEPFLRTVTASPALIARLRTFEHEIEQILAKDLAKDPRFTGDPTLVAALLIAAYRVVAVATTQRRLTGDDLADIVKTHRQRLNQAFDTIEHGISPTHHVKPKDSRVDG